ncbi:MAG: hypothetical protein AMQ74_01633 [Candidatus Methanofastidiosum methylothiophilum]|jgi:hypothetical protein|uniref:DUF432 domain-containing protein n=1 Tax=Candidatus Methanofastidiosum methylothiophilum TaxID=1705564 RepID=A0A150IT07_9EURY|nr:MAG: hypothetical protein AMQ74_01633 [Candidatus Methanofastidiosum methylthiophilus]NMC76672.1 DUF432 domain-containing protein [Candidatus Methanofastidiosa archaeon]
MYGYYKSPLTPLRISKECIQLSVEKEGKNLHYIRKCLDKSIEKILLSKDCGIIINPIEPLNTPKYITPYLLIEFEKAVFVEPKGTVNIFLTFPIEIGVFIYGRKGYDILDIFTLAKNKFTLYGDPRNGIVCKYYKSDIYTSIPNEKDPMIEGIMRLKLINSTENWAEINKAVFDAREMKVYFDENLVSTKANMKLLSLKSAETEFVSSGIKKGMKSSIEVLHPGRLPVTTKKYLMEDGL